MTNFSNFDKYKPKAGDTARFEMYFPGMEESIFLDVLPATASNRPLLAAQAKLSAKYARRNKRKKSPQEQIRDMDAAMEDLIGLYAKYIVRGWENVFEIKEKFLKWKLRCC